MQSTEQKLREALQAYQDANEMSPYGDYSKIEWESSAGPVNPNWGGGDCKKHGRWYGRCYSCSYEWDNLRKKADRDAYTARENALNAAKQIARQVLALPLAVPESLEALSRKLDTQTPDLEVSEMVNGLTQAETDASASVSGLTASPVGERAKFDVWKKTMQDGFNEWDAWQARSALSSGDAVVDAQRYRWLREQSDDDFAFAVVKTPHFDVYESPEELDAAIDAAMRKGQL